MQTFRAGKQMGTGLIYTYMEQGDLVSCMSEFQLEAAQCCALALSFLGPRGNPLSFVDPLIGSHGLPRVDQRMGGTCEACRVM